MFTALEVSPKTINGSQAGMDFIKDFSDVRRDGLLRIKADTGMMANMTMIRKNEDFAP